MRQPSRIATTKWIAQELASKSELRGTLAVRNFAKQKRRNDYLWSDQNRPGSPATSFTWSTIDLFQLAPGQPARANDIAADARGNVFVNGRGADANGVDHGLVRKRSGAGPRLSVRRVPDGLQLAWSAEARDFRLESASTLTDGGDWQGMDLLPAPTSSHSVMAVEFTSTAAFFRLRQP
jgi:hypothetical protein